MKYLFPAISVIILIIVVGGAAFYLGQKSLNNTKAPAQQSQTQQTTPLLTPTPTVLEKTQVSSGGILVFAKYTLDVPSGWVSQKENTQYSDMLTLTKDTYKISIYQAAGGGGGCLYPGDPDKEMAQRFQSFTEISNPNGYVFRRALTGSSVGAWTVCQKNATDGSFGFPTNFGNITITTPANPSNELMTEIDSILASLKKI
ncbi:MAG TPA: hypothetical protein VES68_03675 [Candidatus Sulfotelmatobacter sp.]|nr:hypothetical protein [Candidatus Sulfotelmatobacter sp.]